MQLKIVLYDNFKKQADKLMKNIEIFISRLKIDNYRSEVLSEA